MSSDTRERGILTEADRQYLRNPDEYSRQAAYNREQAISDRLREALMDFELLATDLDGSVLADLLGAEERVADLDDGTTERITEVPRERSSLPFGVAFLLRASRVTETPSADPEISAEASLEPFLRNVELGIEIWLTEHHGLTGSANATVTVDDLQRAEGLVSDLEDREDPLPPGRERLEVMGQLTRAGYSTEEALELVGVPEDVEE